MAENATITRDDIERGRDLISRLPTIVVALSETEYDAATIIAFDPEASIAAGALAGPPKPLERRLFGNSLSYRGWILLARACARDLPRQRNRGRRDRNRFLAERAMAFESMHHDRT